MKRSVRGGFWRVLFLLPVLSIFTVLPAFSQTDPRLVEVIRHAQEGQGDSARIKVQRLLAATSPNDTLYPQIIYTQAMVSNDAAEMRRQLQRVAVEYSTSGWADDALLRLVQLDYASGNLDGASRNLERIRLDYPGSPLLPQAAYWAARTYFDQKRADIACRWIADGLAGSSGNVELQNQLRYLNQRCRQLAAAGAPPTSAPAPDTAGADSTTILVPALPDTGPGALPSVSAAPAPTPPAPHPRAEPTRSDSSPSVPSAGAGARYRIQITAVRSVGTARSLAAKLKSRGFEVVTVQEGGLYKVRVGGYATKAEAAAAVPEVKAKLGGSPFVVAES